MTQYKRKHLAFRNIGEKTIVVHARAGKVITLDDVGCLIWSLLEEFVEVQEVCKAVLKSYPDAQLNVVEEDVRKFLTELNELDLLEASDD